MSTTDGERPDRRGIECRCAVCGHDGLRLGEGFRARCPDCGESFAVRVADGVALLENDGWTVTVSFEVPDGLEDATGAE